MTPLEILAMSTLAIAALPVGLGLINLVAFYRRLPLAEEKMLPPLSVLIPARNEARRIEPTIRSLLGNDGVDFEVVVCDDASTDGTADIVLGAADGDPRVRVIEAPPLPVGWAGKQHACHVLSAAARNDRLVFMDADVRLEPDALARISARLNANGVGMISGFPRQITKSFGERLVIPIITFLLLGYLPMVGMRYSRLPAFGAGCGQLIATTREAYRAAGGHRAIRTSFHDGVTLPRAYRRAGLKTDLFDAGDIATCRMYYGMNDVWHGFLKNATEGMATPVGLPIWTVLLAGGFIVPYLLIVGLLFTDPGMLTWALVTGAAVLGTAFRLLLAVRLGQDYLSALLHPVGIMIVLAIQWTARIRAVSGLSESWRGRNKSAFTNVPTKNPSRRVRA